MAMSALVDDAGDRRLVVKGAPEQVMANCTTVPAEQQVAQRTLDALFADGRRVVAVAGKPAPDLTAITADDERGLTLNGFLVFADEPKVAARDSLGQLSALGIEVKVATGDNPLVAEKVCTDLGLASKGTITGAEMETLDDAGFAEAAQNHTIFARISPEQKARLIVSTRHSGRSVAFLGDGVKTRWPCTRPTWGSRWTPPPTSPRMLPTWCCSKRTWVCSPRASPRAGAFSPTPSNTC